MEFLEERELDEFVNGINAKLESYRNNVREDPELIVVVRSRRFHERVEDVEEEFRKSLAETVAEGVASHVDFQAQKHYDWAGKNSGGGQVADERRSAWCVAPPAP